MGWPIGTTRIWQPCLKGSVFDALIDRMYVGIGDYVDEVQAENITDGKCNELG